jgi:3-isopropylmalate/(R)-2-methylmalate dehydratase small subunit
MMHRDDSTPVWISLPRFTGRAWVFMHNLAAEMILPAHAARLASDEARHHLFSEIGEGVAEQIGRGDILVGGENFGCGAGAAAAVGALHAAGVPVTIARSFGAEFAEAAVSSGIPTLVLDAPESIRTGHTIRVDIDGGRVVDLSSGDRFPIRNLTEDLLGRWRDRLGE